MKVVSSLSAAVLLLAPALSSFADHHGAPPKSQFTEQHKLLAKDVGTWKAEMKMYMAGPDKPPTVVEATEVNTLMEGGLWLLTDFDAGQFKGHGQYGYDPIKKKYVGTWIDTMTPHISAMQGTVNKAGRLVMYMNSIDIATGKTEKMKSVSHHK
ncbi:MAG: DUF1579 family protein, partial [Verrucomicrobiota bacterium]